MDERGLNTLSIYSLRSMARKVGVVAPTTKKKDQLISEILNILNGNQEPTLPKTKQGRPPKKFSIPYENTFSSAFDQALLSDLLTFNQPETRFVYDEIKTVYGYAIISETSSSILLVRDKTKYVRYLIPTSTVEQLQLKQGDSLLAEVGSENSMVKKVFEVNGNLVKDLDPLRRSDFVNIEHVDTDKKLKFSCQKYNQLNIGLGESVLLYDSGNGNVNTDVAIDIINSCELKHKIYINFSFIPKTINKVNNFKFDVDAFFSLVTEDNSIVQTYVCLAIERAKRLCENGDDVLVVVDDLRSISSIDSKDNVFGKNIISLTKNGKNAGSVTIVAICSRDADMSVYEKLADKKFDIEQDILKN